MSVDGAKEILRYPTAKSTSCRMWFYCFITQFSAEDITRCQKSKERYCTANIYSFFLEKVCSDPDKTILTAFSTAPRK